MFKEKKSLISLFLVTFLAFSGTSARATDQSPRPSHTKSVSERPTPSQSNKARPTLSPAQESAIKAAKESYIATIKQAREGASRAIADAKSLLEEQLVAAGKDKELKATAIANYKKNVAAIWAAFKKTAVEAKATLRTSLSTIKQA